MDMGCRHFLHGLAPLPSFGILVFLSLNGLMFGNQPEPRDTKLTVILEHRSYFVGEYVPVRCTLQNRGRQDITGSVVGSVKLISLSATDATGNAVERPDDFPSSSFLVAGRVISFTLKAGEKRVETLLLSRFCRITQPGKYLIHATVDFGSWGDNRGDLSATTAVFLRMPNEVQAEKVIARIEDPHFRIATFRDGPIPDELRLSSLNAPVYLQPLLRCLAQGDQRALEGIGGIATAEATTALIDLAAKAPGDVALHAAHTLIARLPIPAGGPWPQSKVRPHSAERSWNEKLALSVRALALNSLAGADPVSIGAGAEMIEAVGTLDDAAAIFSTMDRLMQPLTQPHEPGWDFEPAWHIIRPNDPAQNVQFTRGGYPAPLPRLLKAAEGLRSRGLILDENDLRGNGQILAYLNEIRAKPPPRSPRWRELLDDFYHSPCVVIREAAIRSIPDPVPADCAALIAAAKEDPDGGVRYAVLWVAEHKTVISPPPGQSGGGILLWERDSRGFWRTSRFMQQSRSP